MILEYVATDASVEGIFVVCFTVALVVAMVLAYWNRTMLMASLKRENDTLRGSNGWKEQKIENLEARVRELKKVAPPEALERINYGGDRS